MHYKVLKGVSEKSSMFDSSWPDLNRANQRAKTLRASLRGSKINVYVSPLKEGEPINTKPVKDHRGY